MRKLFTCIVILLLMLGGCSTGSAKFNSMKVGTTDATKTEQIIFYTNMQSLVFSKITLNAFEATLGTDLKGCGINTSFKRYDPMG